MSGADTVCNTDTMRLLLSSRGGHIPSSSHSSVQSFSGGAAERLTTYVEAGAALPGVASNGNTKSTCLLPVRVAFDMLGISGVTEDMLKELYETFDVNDRGGVERGIMRELMLNGFSNYGAPCTEKDVDRLFERILPFSIRRHLNSENQEIGLISFDEFCALFMAWLQY